MSELIYDKVLVHFDYDKDKTNLWFRTANPLLGGVSPNEMRRLGRYEKLKKFITNAIEENHLP